MAIDFSLKLEDQFLDEKMLLNELRNVGFSDVVEQPNQEKVFTCESCYDSLGFVVSLIKSKEPPYNVVDTGFLDKEFVVSQSVSFDFNKEFDSRSSYENAIRIVFGLMRNANTKALLDMSMCIELCFFNGDGRVVINKSSEIWENINIERELSHWNVEEIKL